MWCLFHFSNNILRQSKDSIKSYWDIKAKNHPSFDICRSLGKIQYMFMYINNLRLTMLIIYSSNLFLNVTSLNIFSQNTSNFSSHCQQVSTRSGGLFWNILCNITAKTNTSVQHIALQKIQTAYWSGLTIRIGAVWGNSAHGKIIKSLLGSAWLGRCTGLINLCTFRLANQQDVKYISATELELNRFWPLPLRELVWKLITQVNDSDIVT